ncbi:MAG TPA: tetratricopeptide repeat protein [Pyrinomonadaceae bacterium]|nr:tetratricopeptide repeat protein [Pyrinomonadaceae bacterium]
MKTTNFIKALFFIGVLSLGFNFVLSPVTVSASEKTILSKNIESGDEKFDRTFRQARELMDKEEWAKAIEKFNELVCDCPDKTYVDAAFYWLAYCYKKQKMIKETNETIDRLLQNFPNSSWADDARVMRYQVYTLTSKPVVTSVGKSTSGSYIANQDRLATELTLAGTATISQQTPLDREDEIKLAAFQSLLAADPKRGIEVLGQMLRTDSKASETLKREVLRTLRNYRSYGFRGVNVYSTTPEIAPTTVVNELNPLLRETLVKSYQNEANVKIRTEILYSIAGINDEASYNYLAQLYSAESNKDLKKAIINSFGSGTYTVFGSFAPLAFVENRLVAEQAVATKGQNMVTTPAPRAVTGQTVRATNHDPKQDTNPIRKLRFDKLMEIFRNEKDLELRRLAFSNLQRFIGWSNSDGMVDMLAQMYDAETDDQFKLSIINSFSNLPQNAQATNKLLNIAKNDKSDKLRLEAIRALRNNNSPEVLKFLEDLIK